MKKHFYLSAIVGFGLLSAQPVLAQLEAGVRKPVTPRYSHPAQDPPAVAIPDQHRPAFKPTFQTEVPGYDQIHTPIRWYAIENAGNNAYWAAVHMNKIWIVLEPGRSIDEPQIQAFLTHYGFAKTISESKRKHQVNYWIFEWPDATPEAVVAAATAARNVDGIQVLEPSVIYKTHYTPNDPYYSQQWGPYVAYFDEAWDLGVGGNSYNVVAVIDDACDWMHEDLYDMVWYGYDYAQEDADVSPDDPNEHKHGTHTTGTVAAKINNGIGVAGMVNDTVYFAKVGTPEGTLSDEAIVNAYYDIGDIARITAVNMSFGGDAPSSVNEQGCNYAWNHGKLLLVSSGNSGNSFVSYPAAYDACMAVGSIGADGTQLYLTNYSQFGTEQEICAPGGDMQTGFGIVSTIPMDQYEAMEGTSMAAPHVTGLAGLMKHINMDLTNAQIRYLINSTAIDYGNAGWDIYFGYGMINAGAAVQAAINGSVGIPEHTSSEVLRVFPNPASERIFIAKKTAFDRGDFEILDITGKVVKTVQTTPGRQTSIEISDLPGGVYILRLKDLTGTSATRFVKV